MKIGDIVRHKFLRTEYIVERLTPKKAEVRAILNGGLSSNTVTVLQRNLESLTPNELERAEAALERKEEQR